MFQAEVKFIDIAGFSQASGLSVEVATQDGAVACVVAFERGGSLGASGGILVGATVIWSYQSGALEWAKRERFSIDPLADPHDSASWLPA